MLASFEMHVSFPLGRECGILFHCMFPDMLPERKEKEQKKKKGKITVIKGKQKSEKATRLFWGVVVIFHFNNFCIFVREIF